MGRWIAVFLVCTICGTQPVHAGAWMREGGTRFSSVVFTANQYRDTGNTAYLEFGVRDDLTFGADIGNFTSRGGMKSGFALFFCANPLARMPAPTDGPTRSALAQLGAALNSHRNSKPLCSGGEGFHGAACLAGSGQTPP
ncbi:hypothetical protein [Sulfitobacter aestuariivivens]|uniref:hypothetical protein n=1 Tax=Sulfitobacter aestuariivivens TaxID=2766981 RepID=UPI0036164FB7